MSTHTITYNRKFESGQRIEYNPCKEEWKMGTIIGIGKVEYNGINNDCVIHYRLMDNEGSYIGFWSESMVREPKEKPNGEKMLEYLVNVATMSLGFDCSYPPYKQQCAEHFLLDMKKRKII